MGQRVDRVCRYSAHTGTCPADSSRNTWRRCLRNADDATTVQLAVVTTPDLPRHPNLSAVLRPARQGWRHGGCFGRSCTPTRELKLGKNCFFFLFSFVKWTPSKNSSLIPIRFWFLERVCPWPFLFGPYLHPQSKIKYVAPSLPLGVPSWPSSQTPASLCLALTGLRLQSISERLRRELQRRCLQTLDGRLEQFVVVNTNRA